MEIHVFGAQKAVLLANTIKKLRVVVFELPDSMIKDRNNCKF